MFSAKELTIPWKSASESTALGQNTICIVGTEIRAGYGWVNPIKLRQPICSIPERHSVDMNLIIKVTQYKYA